MKSKLKLPIEVRKKYFTENGHGEKEIITIRDALLSAMKFTNYVP